MSKDPMVRIECGRCRGSGQCEQQSFGNPKKPSMGQCHICKGKGYLIDEQATIESLHARLSAALELLKDLQSNANELRTAIEASGQVPVAARYLHGMESRIDAFLNDPANHPGEKEGG